MTKKWNYRFALLFVSLMTILVMGGCARKPATVRPAETILEGELLPTQLLEAGNLRIVWQNKLPIKKNESLQRLIILEDRIYGLSDKNYMISMDRQNGELIFSQPIGPIGFPVLGLDVFDHQLYSVIGNNLVEMNSGSGKAVRSMRLEYNVTTPAARNDSYFYIAAGKKLHVLKTDNKSQIFEVAARNSSPITSVIAGQDRVFFTTEAGNLICLKPDEPTRLWQFDAAGSIIDPIIIDGTSIFLATEGMNLYKVDSVAHKLDWKYQTGGMPQSSPRVTDSAVYQSVAGKGLIAINRTDGSLLWQLPEGLEILTEAHEKAYVITNAGKLAVMDNRTGDQRYTVDLGRVTKYVANTLDSKIYVADRKGTIMCLEPIRK